MTDTRRGGRSPGSPGRQLSDEDLDAYILARLDSLGVDLGVLPEDDPGAPADRRRILRSARRFLRETLPAIAAYGMGLDDAPPVMYPTERRARIDGDGG